MDEMFVLDSSPLDKWDEARRQAALQRVDAIRDGNPLRFDLQRMLNSTPRVVLLACTMIEMGAVDVAPRQKYPRNWRF
jgi:ABC-type uncharacterized transport system YnjBCD ATPase subunit